MKKTKRIELTDEMRDAISFAIALAVDDQEHWMSCGDPALDYDDEWPEVARSKAESFKQMSAACVALGMGKHRRCLSLAAQFKAAAKEAEAA